MMSAVTSETSMPIHQTTRRHIPEDRNLHPVYSNKSIDTLTCSVKEQPLSQAVIHIGNYLSI
jgi:hypothetical protein